MPLVLGVGVGEVQPEMFEGRGQAGGGARTRTYKSNSILQRLLFRFIQVVKGISLLKIAGEGVGSVFLKHVPVYFPSLSEQRERSIILVTRCEW